MKWWPDQCKKGDMIRVKLGPLYHYGIFVSEDEVIQFGHPQQDRNAENPGRDIRIFAGNAKDFAAGNMVETAHFSIMERLKRYTASKTVRLARSRIGENGYDILHNNCEHFANMCVFGRKICLQTDRITAQWRMRPVLDVYVSAVGECAGASDTGVEKREKQLRRVKDESLLARKRAAWKLLEYAMLRSFGQKMNGSKFDVSLFGKWTCDKVCFSIAYTDGYIAVAVSNEPVGVDAAEPRAFLKRDLEKLAERSLSGAERAENPAPQALMRLCLMKESVYKWKGKGPYTPKRIKLDGESVFYTDDLGSAPVALAVAGKNLSKLRVFGYNASAGAARIALDGGETVK